MRLTCRTVCFIIPVTIAAFCIMRLKQTISTEIEQDVLAKYDKLSPPSLTDSADNLIWFVQLSDLHLSIFQDEERVIELREFCDLTLKIIRPPVVLVTGDLTDAKLKDLMGSKQIVEEWKVYADVLDKCEVTKTTKWLDIRGNHDNFNVPGLSSQQNMYRKFGAQGPNHERSYLHIEKFNNQYYSFIGVDACPDQGMKRPFNFIGHLTSDEINHLKTLDMAASQSSNYTIWFGHYPTSCMVQGTELRKMIGSRAASLAYVCGHYHSLLNAVPQMHTLQKEHYLELELADWKDNRMFRVTAIDHGILSFVDVKHGEWPVILVLNPKHALYHVPLKERGVTSTHIRILVFSPNEVTSVRVKIDDGEPEKCEFHKTNKNLFVKKWVSSKYDRGIHQIQVTAVDRLGREKTVVQPFSLDGSRADFALLPRLVLMLSFSSVLKFYFFSAVLVCVLPLCVLRVLGRWQNNPLKCLARGYFKNLTRRLWLVSNTPWLFSALVLYPVYLAIGPWAIGEVIDDHLGLIFIWGTYVNQQFVPEMSTYGYGFIQVAVFHFPFIMFVAYSLDQRRMDVIDGPNPNRMYSFIKSFFCNVSFLTILLCQLWMAYIFMAVYGVKAIVFGPARTWPVFMTIGSWYYIKRYPVAKLRVMTSIWKQLEESASPKSEP